MKEILTKIKLAGPKTSNQPPCTTAKGAKRTRGGDPVEDSLAKRVCHITKPKFLAHPGKEGPSTQTLPHNNHLTYTSPDPAKHRQERKEKDSRSYKTVTDKTHTHMHANIEVIMVKKIKKVQYVKPQSGDPIRTKPKKSRSKIPYLGNSNERKITHYFGQDLKSPESRERYFLRVKINVIWWGA